METVQTKQVEEIRKQYAEKSVTEKRLDRLRSLDSKVKRPAEISAYTLGSVSALIFGAGMCLSMGVIGGVGAVGMVAGIVVGVVGAALATLNYFLYKKILKNRKAKYSEEILRLTDEILNQ